MRIENLLEDYSKQHRIPPPSPDSSGIYKLLINNSITVAFENTSDNHGFYIYSVICTLGPVHESENTFKALSGNLFGKETGKSSIAYEPQTRSLVLQEYVPLENIDTHKFNAIVDDFVKYLVYWTNKMEGAAA